VTIIYKVKLQTVDIYMDVTARDGGGIKALGGVFIL